MPRFSTPTARAAALATALCTLGPAASAEGLSEAQLDAARQVYLGTAECEFKQSVHLRALEGRPGHFELQHRKARYTLVPEPTSTGAIRLEDRQAGIVWLQIPAKSMLLNARLGRREVDGCLHAEQRAAGAGDAPSIGIAQR
jgi:hypothetical protein